MRAASLLFLLLSVAVGADLVPLPHSRAVYSGAGTEFGPHSALQSSGGVGLAVQQLQQLLHSRDPVQPIAPPSKHAIGTIVLALRGDPAAGAWLMLHNVSAAAVTSMGREGYILSISNHSTLLTANDARGIFYGVQTLKQLLNKTSRVTAQLIEDKPDIGAGVRGAFLMTHTFEACNVTWLKKAADLMSSLKMNTAIVTAGYFAAVDGLKTNCGDARLQLLEAHHYFSERYIDVVPTLTAGDTSPEQIAALQCGPDIAEGMWVRNETFVVHEDGLHPALPFETGLPTNGNMTEPGKNGLPAGWESSAGVHLCDVDNTSSPFEGGRSLHCTESSSTVGGYAHSNKLSSPYCRRRGVRHNKLQNPRPGKKINDPTN